MRIYFSNDHEYIKVEGDIGVVGISEYAQKQLGDVVYVELPKIGTKVAAGAETAVVESVKVASEIYAPVGGEVIEINSALNDDPSLVNRDPLNTAWFFKIKISNHDELKNLKSSADYDSYITSLI